MTDWSLIESPIELVTLRHTLSEFRLNLLVAARATPCANSSAETSMPPRARWSTVGCACWLPIRVRPFIRTTCTRPTAWKQKSSRGCKSFLAFPLQRVHQFRLHTRRGSAARGGDRVQSTPALLHHAL